MSGMSEKIAESSRLYGTRLILHSFIFSVKKIIFSTWPLAGCHPVVLGMLCKGPVSEFLPYMYLLGILLMSAGSVSGKFADILLYQSSCAFYPTSAISIIL